MDFRRLVVVVVVMVGVAVRVSVLVCVCSDTAHPDIVWTSIPGRIARGRGGLPIITIASTSIFPYSAFPRRAAAGGGYICGP